MPWEAKSVSRLREEFCALALCGGLGVRELCRRFGISPTTGYKWLARARSGEPLEDRPRRPLSSPLRTPEAVEARVESLRLEHPAWGGRKLRRLLELEGGPAPSASTVTAILRRRSLLGPSSGAPGRFLRFEREEPNALWQMDHKGPLALARGSASVLGVLDDRSRYCLVLEACPDRRSEGVRPRLEAAFRRYGMPLEILCDNGPPWGSFSEHGLSPLAVWLALLGVRVVHGRPYHPQTQGKQERFFGTLERELLRWRGFETPDDLDRALGRFRAEYNHRRPHEALGLETPASVYAPSARPFPERVLPPEYPEGLPVRKVQAPGRVSFRGADRRVPKALVGMPVALREAEDGAFEVLFGPNVVAVVDLRHNDR